LRSGSEHFPQVMRAEEETAAEEAGAEEAAVAAVAGRVSAAPPAVTLTAARTTISLRTFLPLRGALRQANSAVAGYMRDVARFWSLGEDPRRDFAKS
jgi:hypothetical protein